ncbi:MAG: hypothetical protein ACN6O7_09880 [Sphingobacterium sp.]
MKRKLSFIFLQIVGFSVLTTFVLAAILQANNEAAKRARDYMPFFTELLLSLVALCIAVGTLTIFLNLNKQFRRSKIGRALSFVLLPAAISLLFSSFLVQAGGASNLFEMLHMAATIVPVWGLILWKYNRFDHWLATTACQY